MLTRNLAVPILESLSDTPVVFLAGPRQVGKSTLAQHLTRSGFPARYLTLDDLAILGAARSDPVGFVEGLEGPTVIDEVQRAGELLLAIKASVDRDRRPGRFLLTGSANVLALPRVADALVGRMALHSLWPLSQGEMEGVREDFIAAVFSDRVPSPLLPPPGRNALAQRLIRGGYPEALARDAAARRGAWFDDYLTTLFHRDLRDLSALADLTHLPRLLMLLGARMGSTVALSDLSRTLAIPYATLTRHLGLLEALFLVQRLPAWSSNLNKRLAKAPKLYLTDTGLAAHLMGLTADQIVASAHHAGPLFEAFVVNELVRQVGWSRVRVRLHHFRTATNEEVDLVLEAPGGRCVGIEIKLAATIDSRDLTGLRTLADAAGSSFHRGVVLYTGQSVIPFAANIHAVPVSTVWQPAPPDPS